MRVGDLRNESVAQADQAFEEARRWVFSAWPEDDWQDIVHAIRDGVNAECLLRDNREYQIPLDGKLYEDDVLLDPATGKKKLAPIRVDPRRAGQRHGHREVRLETRRRLYALTRRRPEPSTFYELLKAINDDDGKDHQGNWLCNRCIPEANRSSEAYPDGSGFDERLPKWMPPISSEPTVEENPQPVPIVVQAPVAAPADQTAAVMHPGAGCAECGGPPYGKGFRHADGCTKSTVRAKAR